MLNNHHRIHNRRHNCQNGNIALEKLNVIDISANFKVYASWDDCMRDHTLLFVNGVDWDPYLYQGVLLADNYDTAAKALQVSGYATDPDYADKVIDVIESNQLSQYD